jgi:hypothetical protein
MKRKLVWGLLAAAVIVTVITVVLVNRRSGPAGEKLATGTQADAGNTKKACDIFTLDVAQQVLGDHAEAGDTAGNNQASSDDISVSTCVYQAGSGADVKIATVLVRGAKNNQGYQSNKTGFQETRNQGTSADQEVVSQKITGVGDDAYFNPATRQVSVLVNKGQYWVITSVANDKTASQKLAQALVSKL